MCCLKKPHLLTWSHVADDVHWGDCEVWARSLQTNLLPVLAWKCSTSHPLLRRDLIVFVTFVCSILRMNRKQTKKYFPLDIDIWGEMEGFALFLRWKNLVILETRVIFISVGPESLTNSSGLVIHETAFQAFRTLGSSINTVAAFVIYCSEFLGLSFLPYWMKGGRGSSVCLLPALYFLGLQIAFSVCHSLPCQLCLSQRLIHFNCTLECTRERWMDGWIVLHLLLHQNFCLFRQDRAKPKIRLPVCPLTSSVLISFHGASFSSIRLPPRSRLGIWLYLSCSLQHLSATLLDHR